MNINFKINAKDEDNYYVVNECTFPNDDFASAFYEIMGDYDLDSLCSFLSEEWPLRYGEAVNRMIKDNGYPKNFDREEVKGLHDEELFYALCKYPLASAYFFTDQFSPGKETNAMLKAVCEFVNQTSADTPSNPEQDILDELGGLTADFKEITSDQNSKGY